MLAPLLLASSQTSVMVEGEMTLAQLELLSWLKLVLKLMVNWDGEEISSHLRVIMNQAPH